MKEFGHAGRIGWRTWLRRYPAFGGDGGEATPVPIPNTAVKLSSADGTAGLPPWESRSPPNFIYGPCTGNGAGAFLFAMKSGLPRSGIVFGNNLPKMGYSVPGLPGGPSYVFLGQTISYGLAFVLHYTWIEFRRPSHGFCCRGLPAGGERTRGDFDRYFDRADAGRRTDAGASTRCGGSAVPSSGGGSGNSDGVPSPEHPAGSSSSRQFEGTVAGQPCPPARMPVPQRPRRGRFRVNRRSGSFRCAEPVGTAESVSASSSSADATVSACAILSAHEHPITWALRPE